MALPQYTNNKYSLVEIHDYHQNHNENKAGGGQEMDTGGESAVHMLVEKLQNDHI